MALEPFEQTSVGYRQAKRWLKANQLRDILEEVGSDAVTTVDRANALRNQQVPWHVEPEYPVG